MTIYEPADVPIAGIPAPVVALVIFVAAISFFAYVMYRRIDLLRRMLPDPRLSEIGKRISMAVKYGFGQWRQPRYPGAGILHILLFAGFMILSLRSLTLIGRGFSSSFHLPFLVGPVGFGYDVIKDYVVLVVLAVCTVCIVRRAVFHPARYEHPGGGGHGSEAYVILGLVSALMVTDMIFDGSALRQNGGGAGVAFSPAASLAAAFMPRAGSASLDYLHISGYWAHILVFFGLLNFLPISKHFHVITAIPNVFFSNMNKGSIKPVQYGVKDWMELEECGVGRFERFTWKHVLDFYSCADCGRCSDNCPSATVGRTLSPRMISIKSREYAYSHYPLFGSPSQSDDVSFTGDVITEDEIWACTTCGACEQECPIFIQYIDKIVDMRRYLVDQGVVPQSLQKPMQQIKKKGNAYGGNKAKRGAWAKDLDGMDVRVLKSGDAADFLFFVDSCGSFDPRIQEISVAFARILQAASVDFGILAADETESGGCDEGVCVLKRR